MALAATPGPRAVASEALGDGVLPSGASLRIGTQTYINAAGYEVQPIATGLTSAGTTQATALVLSKQRSIITSVAASSGVVIPNAGIGVEIEIVNRGTNTLLIYPFSGGLIDAQAANVSVTAASNTTRRFLIASATQIWSTQLS